ncbi:flavin-containing monooxygenase [Nocardioides sp. Kera G14]|uniref:flavin-containing monooxygenase n=1 Tax=Nocardioides sp. Kera G14 TaxID=2884264 RepID=UPI001D0F9A23|nr:NAD(P)/FAD-dependent oxidoreductase [Nocardioides sp. Kera G14]UDY23512.1 NAD(P)/FAD-dependent oxidoreductase [Nocardioides sp. Kera G14]
MSQTTPDVDVLIVGAGLSGIDAAAAVLRDHPGKTVAILERRDSLGGTWDLFKYPGIRSDSDMFTFAFRWRPWESDKTLADGPLIKEYLATVAAETGVDRLIRYGHQVLDAAWDSTTELWTVTAKVDGANTTITSRFLWACSGYYDYDQGFQPQFPGREDFEGEFIHPQFWPEELDYTGKKVVIIGSGATAVTLVPAMANSGAESVTMLQRTPSYIVSRPGNDVAATALKSLPIPFKALLPFKHLRAKTAYEAIRWENLGLSLGLYLFAQRAPKVAKKLIRDNQIAQLTARKGGPGFTKEEATEFVDHHLTPPYNPWDQRLCAVPDGDLWKAIREGRATIVTDHIKTLTAKGIELESGETLEADVIVSATGLNIKLFGGAKLTVDGEEVDPSETTAYLGAMLTHIPNFALTIGYINASWTLKADLVSEWVSGLLGDMEKHGHTVVRVAEPEVKGARPLMDMKSGYLLRGAPSMPRQGDHGPYEAKQNYFIDMRRLQPGDYHEDGKLVFG